MDYDGTLVLPIGFNGTGTVLALRELVEKAIGRYARLGERATLVRDYSRVPRGRPGVEDRCPIAYCRTRLIGSMGDAVAVCLVSCCSVNLGVWWRGRSIGRPQSGRRLASLGRHRPACYGRAPDRSRRHPEVTGLSEVPELRVLSVIVATLARKTRHGLVTQSGVVAADVLQ